jgi:protease-4
MSFAGKVWRLLVGIKDGLSLIFLLLFFILLFGILSSRPSPGAVRPGALLIDLNGKVVEEASRIDPLDVLLSGTLPRREYQERDIVRALDAAATDSRIKAVVFDLSDFTGGGQEHMQAIGAAMDKVRAAKKPVLTFARAYTDDGVMLAAHASEVWVDPLGGAVVSGPGGTNLYYKRLFDKLAVNAHVFRVGTYKSAVEPYMRSNMSPAARANAEAFYGALWDDWQANVKQARPKANIDLVTKHTVAWLDASNGDTAKAALAAGLVDKIGDKAAFGKRVAEIVGKDPYSDAPGSYAETDLKPWLAANKPGRQGKAIGVVTIAGDITDGDEGPGTAGAERISKLLDDALDDNLAALVVRVDSPGGTVTGAEDIRRAILRQKARGIPVVVSMANLAASGGYWVSTTGDRIFAEPETITGSIGIFGVIPTFEKTLAKFGIDTDGIRTTPLSGQVDVLGGLTPETEALVQKTIDNGYSRFVGLVAKSRGKTPAQIDAIGQGRVWDGGTARQIGLVDQFGGLNDALEWAAKKAGLKDGQWHAKFLGSKPDRYDALIRQLVLGNSDSQDEAHAHDMVSYVGLQQRDLAGRVEADLKRLLGEPGAQAYCLECGSLAPPPAQRPDKSTLTLLGRLLEN